MFVQTDILGYIDPSTSQQVFSLLGPILAVLATTGGLLVTGLVVVRRRIMTYFKRASWAKRWVTASMVLGVLVVVALLVWRLVS